MARYSVVDVDTVPVGSVKWNAYFTPSFGRPTVTQSSAAAWGPVSRGAERQTASTLSAATSTARAVPRFMRSGLYRPRDGALVRDKDESRTSARHHDRALAAAGRSDHRVGGRYETCQTRGPGRAGLAGDGGRGHRADVRLRR